MLHAEDALTRLYYVLHIFAAFLMALTVEHPSHDFFHFKAQAHYLAAASILGRVFTAGQSVSQATPRVPEEERFRES